MKELKGCIDHIKTRRGAGDNRPLNDVVAEAIRLFSPKEKTDILHAEVKRGWARLQRQLCQETNRPDDELQEPLPFESKDLTYRCGPYVRVNRDGEIDALRPHHVLGKEIERYDSWDVAQSKRNLLYREDRRRHNKQVSVDLKAYGVDPNTQTIAQMQAIVDQRVCAICGEDTIAGDPWELDHETPIATEKGVSVVAWAHRSCNRSKGKLEIDHLPNIGK
jgi:hypothetical protein